MKINRIYVKGDCHGNYDFLSQFCVQEQTTTEDVLILLGDNALRFEGYKNRREMYRKEKVSCFPITIFALGGNHDRPLYLTRPGECELVKYPFEEEHSNPMMWWDKKYPNIYYFMREEPLYWIKGKKCAILQGAYSVDKEYRLANHWTWFPDEQLPAEMRDDNTAQLWGQQIDYIMSHTCPFEWVSFFYNDFIKGVDQNKIDKTTELWLSVIKSFTDYHLWLFGHYHRDQSFPEEKARILYHSILNLEENKIIFVEETKY